MHIIWFWHAGNTKSYDLWQAYFKIFNLRPTTIFYLSLSGSYDVTQIEPFQAQIGPWKTQIRPKMAYLRPKLASARPKLAILKFKMAIVRLNNNQTRPMWGKNHPLSVTTLQNFSKNWLLCSPKGPISASSMHSLALCYTILVKSLQ